MSADKPAALPSVFILDDHDIVRFGLATLLATSGQVHVVGSASSLTAGLEQIHQLQPDLVISDMSMDDSKGLDTVRAVVQAQAPRRVLIVSMHDEVLYGEQVLSLGARGYLMKETAYAHVLPAAHHILEGGTWVSPAMNSRLLSRLSRRAAGAASRTGESALTTREIEVLEKLGKGKTTKEIAYELELSSRTVDIHRANIKRKLGLRSAAELMAYSLSRT
ncbi:MAG: response regulator transcription factor [Burkholderiales bacterium]|nr:response regulator transcription factor [Burkholderiales bacterium]